MRLNVDGRIIAPRFWRLRHAANPLPSLGLGIPLGISDYLNSAFEYSLSLRPRDAINPRRMYIHADLLPVVYALYGIHFSALRDTDNLGWFIAHRV